MSLYDRLMESDQGPLAEGVKVGDYVQARDGRSGYADRIEAGMVYFKHMTYKSSENVVLPVEEVNVSQVEAIAGKGMRGARPLAKKIANFVSDNSDDYVGQPSYYSLDRLSAEALWSALQNTVPGSKLT
jgi:hypothetical protein